jgi:hypothetical protein
LEQQAEQQRQQRYKNRNVASIVIVIHTTPAMITFPENKLWAA